MNKACRELLEKQGRALKRRSSSNLYIWTRLYWLAWKNSSQLCADTECSLENLQEAMYDRDGWQERERERERESPEDHHSQFDLMMSLKVAQSQIYGPPNENQSNQQ